MTLNSFNGFLSRKTKSILVAASILALAGLFSRSLSFLRNALFAYYYGAGDVLDAYFLAFQLPDFFFNLLFFGAFTVGFVPAFIKIKNESEEKAWRLASDILNLAFIIFAVVEILFFILAPFILKILAPGFDSEKLDLTIKLSRIMFLQPLFLGLSVVFSGILQSTHRFLSYALAPIFYNIGLIFGIVFLARHFGPVGLAWGVVIGAMLHMLVQYPAAKASGFYYKFNLSFNSDALKRIFRVIVPRSLSLIVNQFNLVVMAALASFLGSGKVAIFNFADDLNSLILGVVAVPLGVAVFPVLAQAVAKKDFKYFNETIIKTTRQLLFVIIPASVLAYVLRAQLVRLALGYGKFGWTDTVLTIKTLEFFLIGLIFQGVLAIIMRGFFALEDVKTTFWVLLFGVIASIAISSILAPLMDVSALALATSLAAIFNTIILLTLLKIKIKILDIDSLTKPVLVFIFSSLAGGFVSHVSLRALDIFLDTHKVLHLIIQSSIAGICGVITYLALAYALKSREAIKVFDKLKFKRILLPVLDEETDQR